MARAVVYNIHPVLAEEVRSKEDVGFNYDVLIVGVDLPRGEPVVLTGQGVTIAASVLTTIGAYEVAVAADVRAAAARDGITIPLLNVLVQPYTAA